MSGIKRIIDSVFLGKTSGKAQVDNRKLARILHLLSEASGTNNAVPITYVALKALYDAGTMTVGRYEIIDFQSFHIIPNTTDRNDTYTTIPVEPLIVEAVSASELSPIALSTTYPDDVIYYDITSDYLGSSKATGHKGCITKRIQTKKSIETNFDFRNYIVRRWAGNFTNVDPDGANGAIKWALGNSSISIGNERDTPDTQITYVAESTNVYDVDTNPTGFKDLRVFFNRIDLDDIANFSGVYIDASFKNGPYNTNFGEDITEMWNVKIKASWWTSNCFYAGSCKFADFKMLANNIFLYGYDGGNCDVAQLDFWNNIVAVYTNYRAAFSSGVGNVLTYKTGMYKGLSCRLKAIAYCWIESNTAASAPSIMGKIEQCDSIVLEIVDDGQWNSNNPVNSSSPMYDLEGIMPAGFWGQANTTKKIDFTAAGITYPASKLYIKRDYSNLEAEAVASANISFPSHTDTSKDCRHWAGVLNLTGSGTVNLATLRRLMYLNFPITLKPASGLTISIAPNNVTDGFIQKTTVTANGTNGEVIILTPVGNKWLATS